jgi:hypothetical protein
MSKYRIENLEEDSEALVASKFKVTVEFIVIAESIDDAETEINDVIQEGILALINSDEEREPIEEYDVIDVEPTELF